MDAEFDKRQLRRIDDCRTVSCFVAVSALPGGVCTNHMSTLRALDYERTENRQTNRTTAN